MNSINAYVDLHCHPAMKPLGHSFSRKKKGQNNSNKNRRNSIWQYDPPSLIDKILNIITGLTKFRQANIQALHYGDVKIISASLYPLERGFVCNKLGKGLPADVLANFATGMGKKRIDYIQAIKDYYKDLELEYDFYKQLNGKNINIKGGKHNYRLAKNFTEIKTAMSVLEDKTVFVVLSIEGGHVFGTGLAPKVITKPATVMANVKKVKNWPHRPLFITMAHHFYNELCGHSRSLEGLVAKWSDQSEGLDTGFRPLGRKVLKELLDNKDGKRIYIDIKHMSPKSRMEYFGMLDTTYKNENIPLIVSHGAVNGLISHDNQTIGNQRTAGKFREGEINFYDEELVKVAKSNGIFGLQLDERRIGSESALKNSKGHLKRREIHYYKSRLLWNQIQHIAEILDDAGLFAWNIQSLGTDFDGIIDPLNGFWTAEEMPFLEENLSKHAFNYMKAEQGGAKTLKNEFNRINPTEIVSRVMSDNALAFLERVFI